MDGPDDPAIVADADAASAELAEKLRIIEVECTNGSPPPRPAEICRDPSFAAIVQRYQARYAYRLDLNAEKGRVDALPRLGGYGVTDAEILRRIGGQCEDRCGIAERQSFGTARRAAVDECTKVPGKANLAACAVLRSKASSERGAESIDEAVDDCESECREHAENERRDAAIERRRPKNAAQSKRCTSACVEKCGPPGFCGTCQYSCMIDCAVRTPDGELVLHGNLLQGSPLDP